MEVILRFFVKSLGPDSAVSSVSQLAFGSSQVRFLVLTPFTSFQLLVNGQALSTG